MRRNPLISAALLAACAMLAPVHAEEEARVGKKIADFTLKDHFGKEHSLSDYADSKVVVVAFLGTECPLARLYGPRMTQLNAELSKQGVTFLGVCSNRQDSILDITAYARRHKIEFPILKDLGNQVADQFAAIRTPEFFVLDEDRVVRYWGRIDDQYGFDSGVGYQRPEATRQDMAEAIRELLAGEEVSVPVTKALGCLIGRVREVNETAEVTYSNQIARLVQTHCLNCHREGQIGPFSMESYDEIVGWGEMIREVVEEERMPPWHASPEHGEFSNDLHLSNEQKQLIYDWVDAGCPQGDTADLPEPIEFTEGWFIGEPDELIYMAEEAFDVPAEGVVDYINYIVDPGWKEDVYIHSAEVKPGSYESVHHIIVFIRGPDGRRGGGGGFSTNILAAYVPGTLPIFGGRTGVKIKAGSTLHFQMHYTPSGRPQKDRSYIGVRYAKADELEFLGKSGLAINGGLMIPAGEANHKEVARRKFRRDTLITALLPHMHTRGSAFRYEAVYPDGEREILLDVPTYDFNWQTAYLFKEPKLMPKGTILYCTAHWDNSVDNPNNPDPTVDVRWGDQTWEEMMIGWYVEVQPNPDYRPQ